MYIIFPLRSKFLSWHHVFMASDEAHDTRALHGRLLIIIKYVSTRFQIITTYVAAVSKKLLITTHKVYLQFRFMKLVPHTGPNIIIDNFVCVGIGHPSMYFHIESFTTLHPHIFFVTPIALDLNSYILLLTPHVLLLTLHGTLSLPNRRFPKPYIYLIRQ